MIALHFFYASQNGSLEIEREMEWFSSFYACLLIRDMYKIYTHCHNNTSWDCLKNFLSVTSNMHFQKYLMREEIVPVFLLFFPSVWLNISLTARSNVWVLTTSGRWGKREEERERKRERSEYYGSSENIYQFWRYTRFGSANQCKKVAIISAIKREKQAKREEIRAISSRRSFFLLLGRPRRECI